VQPHFPMLCAGCSAATCFYTLWHSHIPTIQVCTCAPTHSYKVYTTKCALTLSYVVCRLQRGNLFFIPCGTHTFLQYKCARVHLHIPINCTPQSVHPHFPLLCAGCSVATCLSTLWRYSVAQPCPTLAQSQGVGVQGGWG
jgi:hypothetical protein